MPPEHSLPSLSEEEVVVGDDSNSEEDDAEEGFAVIAFSTEDCRIHIYTGFESFEQIERIIASGEPGALAEHLWMGFGDNALVDCGKDESMGILYMLYKLEEDEYYSVSLDKTTTPMTIEVYGRFSSPEEFWNECTTEPPLKNCTLALFYEAIKVYGVQFEDERTPIKLVAYKMVYDI